MAIHESVLLVMDYQNGIVERFGADESVLAPVKHAVDSARSAAIPVIFVRVAFRDGFPEISPNNKSFAAVRERGGMGAADAATQIHPAIAPSRDEPLVTKLRVSAFAGSDLEVLLRSFGASHLVMAGIATSGVVLSTLREAADKDYAITVLSDACLDSDPEVHRVLIEKIFPRQAEVMTVQEWTATLR